MMSLSQSTKPVIAILLIFAGVLFQGGCADSEILLGESCADEENSAACIAANADSLCFAPTGVEVSTKTANAKCQLAIGKACAKKGEHTSGMCNSKSRCYLPSGLVADSEDANTNAKCLIALGGDCALEINTTNCVKGKCFDADGVLVTKATEDAKCQLNTEAACALAGEAGMCKTNSECYIITGNFRTAATTGESATNDGAKCLDIVGQTCEDKKTCISNNCDTTCKIDKVSANNAECFVGEATDTSESLYCSAANNLCLDATAPDAAVSYKCLVYCSDTACQNTTGSTQCTGSLACKMDAKAAATCASGECPA